MRTTAAITFLLAVGLAPSAPAQDEAPAVDTAKTYAAPAGQTPRTATSSPGGGDELGTTIIGERESPLGLYIMPWRNADPEEGIDRPARLLDVEPRPIDPATFRRQLDYHGALSAHRAKSPEPGTTP